MAPPFIFPSNIQDLEEEPDDHRLYAISPIDVTSLSPSELDELVKGVVFDLSDRDLFCIEDHDVFDRVYSLVKGFSLLSPSSKYYLVETIRSNLAVLLPNVDSLARAPQSSPSNSGIDQVPMSERIAVHRNALKIYTYFLITIVLVQEPKQDTCTASKGAGQHLKKSLWNSEAIRGRIINLIANSLEINLVLLFGLGDTVGSYLSFISKFAFSLYENQAFLKDLSTKDGLGHIIGCIATKHKRTAESCASILHLIYKFDFAVPHLVEAVAAAVKRYDDGCLAVALIREFGLTDPKDYARDSIGAENVGRFIVELADRLPRLVSTNVGFLVPHFGGESYKIRNALLGVLGKLVAKAFNDFEGDQSSKILRLRGKQAMLEILIERCKDVSAYTRSRVLQVWAELCEERAVSIGLWNELALVASGRLEDKSAIVRKSALNLLITMLQHNPFGPQLRVETFSATLEKYKEKLLVLEPARSEDDHFDNEITSGEDSHKVAPGCDVLCGESLVQSEVSADDSFLPSSQAQTQENACVPDIGNLEQIKALVASLEAGLQFSKCIASTMTILVQLLASSSVTDVENAILLLMRCRQFQIDGSDECLRKMLPLVFSQDKSIYEAVENAFVSIYIRKNPLETGRNLLNLAINSSIGDLAALECLIGSLVSKGEISQSTISALWDYFSFNVSGVEAAQSRAALSVLCMAAKSSPGILSSHWQDIIDIGFGRWAKVEPLLARTACVALERLPEEDKKKLRCNGSNVFGVLQSLVTGFWLPESIWYAAADKAISTIYSIHPAPENFAVGMAKKSLNSVFSCTVIDETPDQVDSDGMNSSIISTSKLGRFLFVISQIALNQLVYIESCVRKVRLEKSKKDKAKCESEVVDSNSNGATDGINAELGIAASDDAIIDSLSERAEKEIISSSSSDKNVIGYFAPFLSKLCRNVNVMQKYPELQPSAMLALCRLMIIDAEFCEANLQLLFTVVENAPSETVRSNCTVALGDLAVRFPNLLEPWTENMYARLRDPSTSVRKNAVLVLSHLILNDMMKVKGYIDEMAVRIEDKDERISSLAKLFFHELSKKGNNPIYSLLPDILGRLSSQNLEEGVFYNIMQFLITSIKKDKQMEGLVEKLCNRFSGVAGMLFYCYICKIAYCLSQLTFSERGLKKLVESFKAYEHALSEDSVMDYFRAIINKCKKFAKTEVKSSIEEFEEKLNKIHVERKEQDATTRNALAHQKKVGNLGGAVRAKKDAGDKATDEIDAEDETSEVINPSESSESGLTSTGLEHVENGLEVQSPKTSRRGVSRSKIKADKQSRIREQKNSSPIQSTLRMNKRSLSYLSLFINLTPYAHTCLPCSY
ncbi:condensin complex subunit 1 [Dendrobium catenatum]|uniref:condensin complex subunit 1 n=1 Tax=Dendrobium catenatum TaxID=906689 RepID=UPI00109F4424|nr:condensin complex subunit 1 [Dendrobium catenatum]